MSHRSMGWPMSCIIRLFMTSSMHMSRVWRIIGMSTGSFFAWRVRVFSRFGKTSKSSSSSFALLWSRGRFVSRLRHSLLVYHRAWGMAAHSHSILVLISSIQDIQCALLLHAFAPSRAANAPTGLKSASGPCIYQHLPVGSVSLASILLLT